MLVFFLGGGVTAINNNLIIVITRKKDRGGEGRFFLSFNRNLQDFALEYYLSNEGKKASGNIRRGSNLNDYLHKKKE